ncbi:MAG: VWA domain-containing protein [Dehalococcoidia bacterium]
MPGYRYTRWDGTQQPLPIHEDDLMEQLADHLMHHGDVSAALRSLMQRGVQGRFGQRLPGIQEMLQRLRAQRQEVLDRYNLDTTLDSLRRQLDEVIQTERRGIERRLQEVEERYQQLRVSEGYSPGLEEELLRRLQREAQRSRQFLDRLPPQVAETLRQLKDYEFMDDEARTKFNRLLQSLQQKVVDSLLRDLSQHLRGMTPQALDAMKEMLRDLNRVLEQKLNGERPQFDQFMQKYGGNFGPNGPASLEELLEHLQRQLSDMESLLKSLSPQVRQELEEALNTVFRDQELQGELLRLAASLEHLNSLPDAQEFPFQGEDPVSLDEALQLVRHLQRMDELEKQLRRTQQGASLADVDPELVRELLGEVGQREVQQLQRLVQVLEEAGYIRQMGNRFELTPLGMRRIGQKALQEVFAYLKRDRVGHHPVRSSGWGGELLEETKQYEFGDLFHPHLQRSLMNAVLREPGVPVQLQPGDFEVYRNEQVAHAATILMLDLSLSMAMRGNFLAAKKVALALDNLIRLRFPRDSLHIVGFSTYAREVKPEKLPYLTWDEFDPYTNIQHGLALARKLLSRSPAGTRQIIMISDGEPTAHLEGGQLYLQYPPSPRTIRETLREVRRCTQVGITINTFMLERSSYLMEFVDQMTRINRGRVFYTSPERLGEYLLVDYVSSRRRLVS